MKLINDKGVQVRLDTINRDRKDGYNVDGIARLRGLPKWKVEQALRQLARRSKRLLNL